MQSKKIYSKHWFFRKLENFILDPFWDPFDPKILKQSFSHKKIFKSILSLYATVTLCQKSEKIYELVFDETWKTSFLGLFGPKTSNQDFNQKVI